MNVPTKGQYNLIAIKYKDSYCQKEKLSESIPLGICNFIQYQPWVYPAYDSAESTSKYVEYTLSGIISPSQFMIKSCLFDTSECTSQVYAENCEHFNISSFQCKNVENDGYVIWSTDSPLNPVVDDDIPPSVPTPKPSFAPASQSSNHNLSLYFTICVGAIALAYIIYTFAKSRGGSYSQVPDKDAEVQLTKA